ncbi:DUF1850 domain-containing protein [Solibacillus sp. CAU 1738]
MLVVETEDERMLLKPAAFTIGWVHSVEKEPWYECYEVQNKRFHLYETYFKTYGAGVPSDGEVIQTNDGFIHLKMDLYFPEIMIAASAAVETTLYIGNKEWPLYGDERQSVRLYIETDSFIQIIFKGGFK